MPLSSFLLTASGFIGLAFLLFAGCVYYDRSRACFTRRARWMLELEAKNGDARESNELKLQAQIDDVRLDLIELAATSAQRMDLLHDNNQVTRNYANRLADLHAPHGGIPAQNVPVSLTGAPVEERFPPVGLNDAQLNAAAQPYTGPHTAPVGRGFNTLNELFEGTR